MSTVRLQRQVGQRHKSVVRKHNAPSVAVRAARAPATGDAPGGSAEGEIRTHTPLRAADFKSAASAIPPLRHVSVTAAESIARDVDRRLVTQSRAPSRVDIKRVFNAQTSG